MGGIVMCVMDLGLPPTFLCLYNPSTLKGAQQGTWGWLFLWCGVIWGHAEY